MNRLLSLFRLSRGRHRRCAIGAIGGIVFATLILLLLELPSERSSSALASARLVTYEFEELRAMLSASGVGHESLDAFPAGWSVRSSEDGNAMLFLNRRMGVAASLGCNGASNVVRLPGAEALPGERVWLSLGCVAVISGPGDIQYFRSDQEQSAESGDSRGCSQDTVVFGVSWKQDEGVGLSPGVYSLPPNGALTALLELPHRFDVRVFPTDKEGFYVTSVQPRWMSEEKGLEIRRLGVPGGSPTGVSRRLVEPPEDWSPLLRLDDLSPLEGLAAVVMEADVATFDRRFLVDIRTGSYSRAESDEGIALFMNCDVRSVPGR